jgi:hypothetical protein
MEWAALGVTKKYINFGGETVCKRPFGRPRRRWENKMRTNLRQTGCKDRGWMDVSRSCPMAGFGVASSRSATALISKSI